MTTEEQGIRTLEAWDELLVSMEDAGDEDLEVLRDFHVLWMVGSFKVWPDVARNLHHAAELAREAVRVSREDHGAEVKP